MDIKIMPDKAQMGKLLEREQRRSAVRPNQSAGMNESFGDHAVERCGDLQIVFECLQCLDRRGSSNHTRSHYSDDRHLQE